MTIIIGLLIIAIGAFCQASSYVPINKVKNWSWESYWLVQGLFAWLLLPLLGALLAVPAGHQLYELFANQPRETLLTIFYGALWGIGGLTFGLSMRYLGVALGQSVALGICAAMGTVLAPIFTSSFVSGTSPCSMMQPGRSAVVPPLNESVQCPSSFSVWSASSPIAVIVNALSQTIIVSPTAGSSL